MRPRSIRLAVALAILVGVVAAGGAAQAGGGAPSMTLVIDPTSGVGGTEIDVSGTCFEDQVGGSCDQVEISLLDPDDVVVDSDSADTDEEFYSGVLTVPPDATCGDYTVVADGIEGDTIIVDEIAIFTVTVDCPTTTTAAPTTAAPTTAPSSAAAAAAVVTPAFTG
jgi:hypothetical protein